MKDIFFDFDVQYPEKLNEAHDDLMFLRGKLKSRK